MDKWTDRQIEQKKINEILKRARIRKHRVFTEEYISTDGLRILLMHVLNTFLPRSTFFKILKEAGITPDRQLISGIRLFSLRNIDEKIRKMKSFIEEEKGWKITNINAERETSLDNAYRKLEETLLKLVSP